LYRLDPPRSWQKILMRRPRIDWVGPGAMQIRCTSTRRHIVPSLGDAIEESHCIVWMGSLSIRDVAF